MEDDKSLTLETNRCYLCDLIATEVELLETFLPLNHYEHVPCVHNDAPGVGAQAVEIGIVSSETILRAELLERAFHTIQTHAYRVCVM